MKFKAAPLKEFAQADAITMREWEAMGRLVVTIEEELHEKVRAVSDETAGPLSRTLLIEYAVGGIRSMMKSVGLNPADWYIHIAPKLEPAQPIPQQIENWTVTFRLLQQRSKSKEMAAAVDPDHKPTLSEQFGKKNE